MASESGCPIEFHRIDVDKCDPVFDKECQGNKYIPFLRADYDRQTGRSPNSPREQVISSCLGSIFNESISMSLLPGDPSRLYSTFTDDGNDTHRIRSLNYRTMFSHVYVHSRVYEFTVPFVRRNHFAFPSFTSKRYIVSASRFLETES